MLVKLCGFREENSLKTAINCGCNFLGFIFYDKSVRGISTSKAKELFAIVPTSIAKVAVVVDPESSLLEEIANLNPDYIQFHGLESPEFIKNFKESHPKIKIIKAFRVGGKEDLVGLEKYDFVDLFLFDSKVKSEVGGSGQKFDWSILKDLKINKKWILSGGLNVNNIDEAVKETGAKIVDISSGIEESKGVKSSQKITQLMNFLVRY